MCVSGRNPLMDYPHTMGHPIFCAAFDKHSNMKFYTKRRVIMHLFKKNYNFKW